MHSGAFNVVNHLTIRYSHSSLIRQCLRLLSHWPRQHSSQMCISEKHCKPQPRSSWKLVVLIQEKNICGPNKVRKKNTLSATPLPWDKSPQLRVCGICTNHSAPCINTEVYNNRFQSRIVFFPLEDFGMKYMVWNHPWQNSYMENTAAKLWNFWSWKFNCKIWRLWEVCSVGCGFGTVKSRWLPNFIISSSSMFALIGWYMVCLILIWACGCKLKDCFNQLPNTCICTWYFMDAALSTFMHTETLVIKAIQKFGAEMSNI